MGRKPRAPKCAEDTLCLLGASGDELKRAEEGPCRVKETPDQLCSPPPSVWGCELSGLQAGSPRETDEDAVKWKLKALDLVSALTLQRPLCPLPGPWIAQLQNNRLRDENKCLQRNRKGGKSPRLVQERNTHKHRNNCRIPKQARARMALWRVAEASCAAGGSTSWC